MRLLPLTPFTTPAILAAGRGVRVTTASLARIASSSRCGGVASTARTRAGLSTTPAGTATLERRARARLAPPGSR